jgi:hypothetical protein
MTTFAWMRTEPRVLFWLAACAAPLLALLPSLVIATWIFPTMDDAWLFLLVRESGLTAIAENLRARPFFAQLLTVVGASQNQYLAVGLMVSAATWMLLALESAIIWRYTFPEIPQLAPLGAALVVAPSVVTTQLATLTVALPVMVPTIAGFAALLVAWRFIEGRGWPGGPAALCVAAGLILVGSMVSEYVVAPALAAGVISLWLAVTATDRAEGRRAIAALVVLAAATLAGQIGFHVVADRSARPDAQIDSIASEAARLGLEIAANVASSLWRATFGAYFASFATIRFSFYERSTILATLWGGLLAIVLLVSIRRSVLVAQPLPRRARPGRIIMLLVAAACTLVGEALRGGMFFPVHPATAESLGTRFFIPCLPLAACLTTVPFTTWQGRHREIAIIMIAVALGYCAFLQPWDEWRRQPIYAQLGRQLRPYVEREPKLTIAVISPYLGRDYEVHYKVTRDWPAALSRRLWTVWIGRVRTLKEGLVDGSDLCHDNLMADVDQTGIRRAGPVGTVVRMLSERPVVVDRFCESK